MALTACLSEANKAEFVCGILGVIAYLCEKLFMCPEQVTQSFALGDFICDSSYLVVYAQEKIVGDRNHVAARSEMELTWNRVERAISAKNVTDVAQNISADSRLFNNCEDTKGQKHTMLVCGLLGSFGFICGGLECPTLVTETFVTGDFICDLSSVLKYIAKSASEKGNEHNDIRPHHRASKRQTFQQLLTSSIS